jgi:RNA polymerase sigma-70 factor, ECF subfamily
MSARLLVPEEAAGHVRRLDRLARRACGAGDQAEDLVQETYARVLARPRRITGDDDFNYLARTLVNLAAKRGRARARIGPVLSLEDTEPADPLRRGDPETALLDRELRAEIERLPTDQRAAVTAVDLLGMSYRQAADALGVPIGTVMSRLHRARGRLAQRA